MSLSLDQYVTPSSHHIVEPEAFVGGHGQFGKDLWIEEAVTHPQPGGLQQPLRGPQMLVENRDAVRNMAIKGGVKTLGRIHQFHDCTPIEYYREYLTIVKSYH
jgi:hypothetical protein